MKGPEAQESEALLRAFREGRYAHALDLARSLTERFPGSPLGWTVLSATLDRLGRLEEAEASYRRMIELSPTHAAAHSNLGSVLSDLGKLAEAEASFRRAAQLEPGLATAHANLGSVLSRLGRLEEAEACCRRALQLDPGLAEAHASLALLLGTKGDYEPAFGHIVRSLQLNETPEARSIFVNCVRHLQFAQADEGLRAVLVRALRDGWARPAELAEACTAFVKLPPGLSEGSAADPLLLALLDCAPVCDLDLERFLTVERQRLLDAAIASAGARAGLPGPLEFHCALARQCFINEYVFAHTDEEIARAGALKDSLVAALEKAAPLPVAWPVAVAAYFPLHALPFAERLRDRTFPDEVMALLRQQIDEPAEERRLRETIPRLTPIEGEVSRRVRDQYEENPYPRWVKLASEPPSTPLGAWLRQRFPLAGIQPTGAGDAVDVLVAGCGTGQHPIETACRIRGARVLAVDLSLASLAYARRKSRELGLEDIEYAQADLLELGALERRFDVVESVGVLHHLADPFAGWRVLLTLLRPGGFMRLGLYSEAARREVARARSLVAGMGGGASANAIRKCRQALIRERSGEFDALFRLQDFFSLSACRDLLFHVQEHGLQLPQVDAFLRENGLAFLGFDIDPGVLRDYRRRFPADPAATSLAQWHLFEADHPDTFLGMYQFWIQKPAAPGSAA